MKRIAMIVSLICSGGTSVEQAAPPAATQHPQPVTLCQLAQAPAAYNHVLVKVSATASQGFEDFTLHDSSCQPPIPDDFSVWLTYGGTMKSGTVYCCPGEGEKRQRMQPVAVEGIRVPLVNNIQLRRFISVLRQKPHIAKATLVGVFFAGERQTSSGQPSLPGYGHLGCCSLLVIRQVESVEP